MQDDPNTRRAPPTVRTWLEGPHTSTLTELRALEFYSRGLTIEMIADVTGYEKESVRSQLKACRYRFQAKNTTHAACQAIRLGLIP